MDTITNTALNVVEYENAKHMKNTFLVHNKLQVGENKL